MREQECTNTIRLKTEEIIKLKTTIHHFKTWCTIAVLLALLLSYIGYITYKDVSSTMLRYNNARDEQILVQAQEIEKLKKENDNLLNDISLVYVTKEHLLNDLIENYPEISTKVKIDIIQTIISESEKYGNNPLIGYSIGYNESSFKPWMEHDLTTIIKNGKPIKIRAVGIMGVVWEWWGDKLKEAGIAETRGDLFDPVINIKAGMFVYNEMYKMDKLKSAKNKDESALLRYFGGNYPAYVQRIDAKISSLIRPGLYRKR